MITQGLQIELCPNETNDQAMARNVASTECLNTSVLTICQHIDPSQISEMVSELSWSCRAVLRARMAKLD